MVIDWAGLGARISNMAIDVEKAAEENVKKVITYLGVGGAVLVVIGLFYLFKKK